MTRASAIAILALGALPAAPPSGLAPVDETGYQKLIAGHKGKVVLVNFWATWCQPCRAEMPQLVKLEARLRARGFTLLTVSADDPEQEGDALAFLKKTAVPGPLHIKRAKNDEKFINAIDPKWSGALPATFLYDRTGRKARSFIGEVEMAELEAAVRKLL